MEVLGCMTGIQALKRTDVRRHGDRPFTFRTGHLHPPQRKRDEGTMRQRERVIAQRRAGLLRGCGRGPCRRSVYRSTVRTDGDDVGKPFCAMIVAEKPIVKVSPINVDVCFHLFKMLRPRPFRIGASPRIGRASRSDVNLLRGSMGIIPNPVGLRKRLDFPKTKIRATGANHR